MYIVIFDERDGYFGPFETREEGSEYIDTCKLKGRVVSLVKPFSLGR